MTIRGLIEAIERGDMSATVEAAMAAFTDLTIWRHVLKACGGSLDAAKALHDALLPGCGFFIGDENGESGGDVIAMTRNPATEAVTEGSSTIPARAWLLAILRALEGDA